MLYPDSKIIGGKRKTKKSELKSFVKFSKYKLYPKYLKIKPPTAPIMTVNAASYKYLCPDLCNKVPPTTANTVSAKTIRTSVLISRDNSCEIF